MKEEMRKELTDMCDAMELDILDIKHRLTHLGEPGYAPAENKVWIGTICDGLKHTATTLQNYVEGGSDSETL